MAVILNEADFPGIINLCGAGCLVIVGRLTVDEGDEVTRKRVGKRECWGEREREKECEVE